MNEVLLTVSGEIDPDIENQIAEGLRPMADYIAMAHGFEADLLDYTAARKQGGSIEKLLERIGGPNLLLAWTCFRERHSYKTIFTDGEQVGLPLAFLLKFLSRGIYPRHLMIAHILTTRPKAMLVDLFHLYTHIDIIFVYSTWQERFIETRWSVSSKQVVFTQFMVDSEFFSPVAAESIGNLDLDLNFNGRPLICSVGLERRDYPSLIEAVRGLDLQLVIAAASPWSKQGDSTQGQELPSNVTVQRFTQYELRDLYARSRFMVMPLYDVPFQAGVTAILEAMSMEKAVIVTQTLGQTDVIKDQQTGIYVQPGDVGSLRNAICQLLDNPTQAIRMGARGRQVVLGEMSLEHYTRRLNEFVNNDDNDI
jgi:glycosyltransferase involved in cell wall biosynthesis